MAWPHLKSSEHGPVSTRSSTGEGSDTPRPCFCPQHLPLWTTAICGTAQLETFKKGTDPVLNPTAQRRQAQGWTELPSSHSTGEQQQKPLRNAESRNRACSDVTSPVTASKIPKDNVGNGAVITGGAADPGEKELDFQDPSCSGPGALGNPHGLTVQMAWFTENEKAGASPGHVARPWVW